MRQICRFIEQHLDEPVTLERLGEEFGQSPFHLQRTFKKALGITPKAYADSCRMGLLKRNLQAGRTVTHAMYDAGYSSSSRLYERTASQLGMTPDKYRRGAIAATIRYTCTESPLGRMLVAATEKGICAIQFGDTDDELVEGLKREFPFAVRRRDDESMRSLTSTVLNQIAGHKPNRSLPLDIQATAFQKRVWTHLSRCMRCCPGPGPGRGRSRPRRTRPRPSRVHVVADTPNRWAGLPRPLVLHHQGHLPVVVEVAQADQAVARQGLDHAEEAQCGSSVPSARRAGSMISGSSSGRMARTVTGAVRQRERGRVLVRVRVDGQARRRRPASAGAQQHAGVQGEEAFRARPAAG